MLTTLPLVFRRVFRRAAIFGLIAAMASCAREPLPLPAETAAARAPYPQLLPLDQITALPAPEDPAASLQARAAALKARARAIETTE